MNREILFRAKSSQSWCYGYVHKDYESPMPNKWRLTTAYGDVKVINSDTIGEWTGLLDKNNVVSETVGEYTGLTDKNGTKIFEGDIVKIERYFNNNFYTEDNYVCKYDTNTVSFKFYYIVPKDITDVNKYAILGDGAALSDMGRGFTIEAIGNIWDNPELIEE